MTRTLLISTGISCLIGGIIFMYFKNRMGRIEKKVDLMFQLIQEYEQTKSNYPQDSENPPPNETDINLINVSDDDFSDDSDSDEVSDEETIHISDNIDKNKIKSINLEGAETNSFPLDNLDDISDLEENREVHLQKNDVIAEKQNSEVEFKEKTIGEISNENHKENDDGNEDGDEDGNEDGDEDGNEDGDEDGNEDGDEDGTEDGDEDGDEDVDNLQNTIKQIISETDKSLKELSVRQLKQMCETQGFTNYKALRKNKLIELLQNE